MLDKAAQRGADSVILDLEDGTALEDKGTARLMVGDKVRDIAGTGIEVIVRINPLSSEWGNEDIKFIAEAGPDTIMVPKATEKEIKSVSDFLDNIERAGGTTGKVIKIILVIETAYALENISGIIHSSNRVDGVMFGAEDYTADMQLKRTTSGKELSFARSRIAVSCRASKIDAIDTPYTAVNDFDGLGHDASEAVFAGMTGKAAIHPGQIDKINELFSPSGEEIEYAERLVKKDREMRLQGKAVFVMDGKMVDAPVIKRAEKVLNKAELAGLYKASE